MKRAVILHGLPSDEEYHDFEGDSQSNDHWLPWLQQQLCARDILTQTPEMPNAYDPKYEEWKEEFERQVVDEDTLLVGHSCGGGFLLRWLSEENRTVGHLVLVAPWLDREKVNGPLFEFDLDPSVESRIKGGIDLLYSTNDETSQQTSLEYLRQSGIDIRYHEFKDYGHFCLRDMKTREFPELLEICLDKNSSL